MKCVNMKKVALKYYHTLKYTHANPINIKESLFLKRD
jgi:hypothetical protein